MMIAYIYNNWIEKLGYKDYKMCLDRVQTVDIGEYDKKKSLNWFLKTDKSPCGNQSCLGHVLQKLQQKH